MAAYVPTGVRRGPKYKYHDSVGKLPPCKYVRFSPEQLKWIAEQEGSNFAEKVFRVIEKAMLQQQKLARRKARK